jgi:hypothetical protein
MLLEIRLLSIGSAVCTDAVKWLSAAHRFLNREHDDSRCQLCQLIPRLISFPVFEASHLCFKIAYRLNQRRLRLLCREDFFLKFYRLLRNAPRLMVTSRLSAFKSLSAHRREQKIHLPRVLPSLRHLYCPLCSSLKIRSTRFE